jgi:hypothetical protein
LDGGLKDGHIGSAERLDTEVLDSGSDGVSMGAQTTPASAQNIPVSTAVILASPVSPSTSSQTPGGALMMAAVEAMHEITTSFQVEKAASVSPVTKGRSTTTVDSFSREEVVAFGGIQDPAVMSPRSSERVWAQSNADATQMERDVSLTNKKNVMISLGTNLKFQSKLSLLSLSDDVIIHRASKLGVSLGDSNDRRIESVNIIKNLEMDRRVVFLKNNLDSTSDSIDNSMVISRASNLCGDLSDEADKHMEENLDIPLIGLRAKKGKTKKGKDIKVSVRRSTRLKKLNNL